MSRSFFPIRLGMDLNMELRRKKKISQVPAISSSSLEKKLEQRELCGGVVEHFLQGATVVDGGV